MVHSKLPGIQLDEMNFWSLDRAERNLIRQAFLAAYQELCPCVYQPAFHSLENLLWNKEEYKVYIIDFKELMSQALRS
ncbi:hypothetical protein BO71DRAFT_256031 [Aspergillus ellipticus CBS 707.79]|uniref:Uncharacterized protein n=1 Tax=Aspergillus ellipticus CBS 707.79 TaxID=1448320 RepID=A0A319DQ58_9EURO|nr:hypothetical protein BO71DRAFT_256031 [Aspergillus ellipticus CBS 707.79]